MMFLMSLGAGAVWWACRAFDKQRQCGDNLFTSLVGFVGIVSAVMAVVLLVGALTQPFMGRSSDGCDRFNQSSAC